MSLIEIQNKIKFKNFVDLSKEEALQVLGYRNMPEIRKNMLTQEIITRENHFQFIRNLNEDSSKRYFGVLYCNSVIGAVSLVDIDEQKKSASWGFYIGEKPIKGIGSIVEYLFIEFVFNILNFNHLFCEVFEENVSVIKLHRRFGFSQNKKLYDYARINNTIHNGIQMGLEKTTWDNSYKDKIQTILNQILR